MDPGRSNLHAFLAFASFRLFNGRDRVEMRTSSIRHILGYFENLDLVRDAAERALLRLRGDAV